MNIGADTAARWREVQARQAGIALAEANAAPPPPPPLELQDEVAPAVRTFADTLPTIVFAIVVAVVVASIAAGLEANVLRAADFIEVASVASGPLALVGILYLLLLRTSRREARRFGDTARAMRRESAGLERTLATLSARIEENRVALSTHAQQLLALGEDTSSRLADIGMTMRTEATALSRQSDKLDEATASARADLGVLLSDLPRAESQTRAMAALLREAGLGAQQHAVALEGQLGTLSARGREVDEHVGGAAQRLAAQVARIDGTSEVAGRRMDDAATRMQDAIDRTLGEAARAIDEVRKSIDGQQGAMRAMVEEASATFERAGADATTSIAGRLAVIATEVETIDARLSAQDAGTASLLSRLQDSMAAVETRFAGLDTLGADRAAALGQAIATLRTQADEMAATLSTGGETTDTLIVRADALKTAFAAAAHDMAVAIPAALVRIEEQASETRSALSTLGPAAASVETSAANTADRLRDAEAALERQQAALAELNRQGTAFEALIAGATKDAADLTEGSAPRLVEALLRVKETAQASAEHARTALASVIPDAARALGEASGAALDEAVSARVAAQVAAIGAAAERSVEAAEGATARLASQIALIGDRSAEIDARFAESRAEAEERDEHTFARRVALLIESLNSTAIDVTKLLSNDVTDTAWAAYLKGDRGIFTRRAVRLLDSAELKAIARHYEDEPEFRDQVNRYIHDFEGMLRRILATRDGNPLGVTLLSSDMGKLYVALAQAIERLR